MTHAAGATLPQALRAALSQAEPKTLRDLSQQLGVSEKLLPDALDKLEKSLRREGARLQHVPAACLGCGFEFTERSRHTRPGRCPRCRSERIMAAKFRLLMPGMTESG